MPAQKQLIITADDYGYSVERNEGIIKCFRSGAVSNVSVLVNAVAVEDGVKLAKDLGIPMGLHLNLTEGLPVRKVPYQTLINGNGVFHGKHGFREAIRLGKIDMGEVREEIQCQINRFKELTGCKPKNVDGHQHIHVIPGICEVFASVLHANNIHQSRLPIAADISQHSWKSKNMKAFMEEVVENAISAQNVFTQAGIWAPNFTGHRTMGSDMSLELLQKLILDAFENERFTDQELKQNETEVDKCTGTSEKPENNKHTSYLVADSKEYIKCCELMVHPGKITGEVGGCGDGPDDFSQSPDREHELEILCSEDMVKFYKQCDIQLISFQDVTLT